MTKRALCVGINLYLDPRNNLRGCRNDAFDMAAFLQIELGVEQKNTVILLDKTATKANIIRVLTRMVAESMPGDYLAYCHSSHGTQVMDKNGDELDGYDEALCCYDTAEKGAEWDPDTIIIDDELRELFARLPQDMRVEAWFDTCHSGSGLRQMGMTYDRARIMLPHDRELIGMQKKRLGLAAVHSGTVLWAGCEDSGLSADTAINGKWCGAFTNAFLNVYRPILRGAVLTRVRQCLYETGYSQVPQLDLADPELRKRRVGR